MYEEYFHTNRLEENLFKIVPENIPSLSEGVKYSNRRQRRRTVIDDGRLVATARARGVCTSEGRDDVRAIRRAKRPDFPGSGSGAEGARLHRGDPD